jgi:hypothetical protein
MPTRADSHRRPLSRIALGACCLVLAASAPAFGQPLEFKSSEIRGRIDRPSSENIWVLGDDNGNGTLDEKESFGPRIDLNQVFPTGIGRGHYQIAPANSFGSVMVAFEDPYDPMFGYIDVVDALGGPFQPDGLADDINGDGQFDGYDNDNPGREPDVIFGPDNRGDFDDLVQLPQSYQSIGANTFANFGGAHLMNVLRFEGDPDRALSATHETLEIGYGARFYGGLQDYRLNLAGGTLGVFNLRSDVESQALGPQLSVKWTLRRGPWQASADAAAALTYMNIDGDQHVHFGQDLVPGQYNRGLYLTPTQSSSHLNDWDVAPALEAGVRASYDVTPSMLCFIRGDAIQFGNARDAQDAIVFQLPRMGLRDPGGYDVTVTAATIGVEVRR